MNKEGYKVDQDNNLSIVSVHSYKGGVGKTSMSVLLGAALAKENPKCKIVLVDLDILAPGMHHMLAIDHLPSKSILHYLVADYSLSPELWSADLLCVDVSPEFPNLQVAPCFTDPVLASKAQMYILGDACSGLLEARLETMLEEIRDFHNGKQQAGSEKKQVIFVLDCPPSLFGISRAALELAHRNCGYAMFVCNPVFQDLAGVYEMVLLQETILNEDKSSGKSASHGFVLNRLRKDAMAGIKLKDVNDSERVRRKLAANFAFATETGMDRTMRKLLESALEAYWPAIVLDCEQISAMSSVDSEQRGLQMLEDIFKENNSIKSLSSEIGRVLRESWS